MMYEIDVSRSKYVIKYVVTHVMARPRIPSTFGPNSSKSLPVIGDIIPITIAPGSIIRPESNADIPRTLCTYAGVRIIPENKAAELTTEINDASANIGCLYTDKFSSGCSILNCRRVNRMTIIAPTAIVVITTGSPQPSVLAELKP